MYGGHRGLHLDAALRRLQFRIGSQYFADQVFCIHRGKRQNSTPDFSVVEQIIKVLIEAIAGSTAPGAFTPFQNQARLW